MGGACGRGMEVLAGLAGRRVEGCLSSFEILYPLFLFPDDILELLVFVEGTIDADVGIVEDIPAV